MTKIAILIPLLAACAVETTSSTDQPLCKLDPLTGQCPTRASTAAEGWIDNHFPDAVYDSSLDCFTGTDSAGHSNIQCTVTIEWEGTEYWVGCSWWSSGSLDCDAGD